MSFRNVFAALTLSWVFASQSFAEDITIAYSHFPPLTGVEIGQENVRSGLLHEMYIYALTDLGYTPQLLQYPPNRIKTKMAAGEDIDLYICGEFSKGKRPQYLYGPRFLTLTAVLIQNVEEPPLEKVKDLKGTIVLKQRGFGGLSNLIDPSNTISEANFKSIVPMFARRRVNYLIDYKERIEPLLREIEGIHFRMYEMHEYGGFLCLNRRFDNVDTRLKAIHEALVSFQDTDEGIALFEKYKYSGRFGE
ncbi:MAG: hypothetical protein OQJ97_03085 [Rhodospirillales bacterium]|nr:hypothetical protein [Rhodospirillales bacterium]